MALINYKCCKCYATTTDCNNATPAQCPQADTQVPASQQSQVVDTTGGHGWIVTSKS